MVYKISLSPLAKEDIKTARRYYLDISIKLDRRFNNRIIESKKILIAQPLAFAVKYKNVRTYLLTPFPYHVHYIIENQEIVIISVTFSKQDNNDFHHRIK